MDRIHRERMADRVRRALLLSMAGAALGARGEPAAASPMYRVLFDFPWGTNPRFAQLSEGVIKGTAAGLERFGYFEGRNLALFPWRAGRDREAVSWQLAQLRARPPHAIVAALATVALAWRQRMPSVPIVAWAVIDPVASGLAETFVRPGRNITGLTQSTEEVAGELVDILREFVPGVFAVTIFFALPPGPRPVTAPAGAAGEDLRELECLERAATRAGLRVRTIPSSGREAVEALRTMRTEGYQQLARVLALGDASNLPFIAPSRFRLVINARTAQRLGLRIPPGLEIAADRIVL